MEKKVDIILIPVLKGLQVQKAIYHLIKRKPESSLIFLETGRENIFPQL